MPLHAELLLVFTSCQLTPPSKERCSLPPVTPANNRLPSTDIATVDQFRLPAAVLATQVAPLSADIQIDPWTSVATNFTPSGLDATEFHKRGLATAVQFVPLSAEVYNEPPYTEATILLPSADTAIEFHNCAVARAVQFVPLSTDTYT